jgi:hypothetical protein
LFNTVGAAIGFWLGSLLPDLANPYRRLGINTEPGPVQRLVTFIADVILSNAISALIIIPFYLASGRDGIWQQWQLPISVGVFFILQLVVPLLWNGRTIASKFTGVSLDDRPRTPVWRFTYYLVRAFLLGAVVFTGFTGRVGIAIWLLTIVWYLVSQRKMPYTLVDKFFDRSPVSTT